MNHFGARSMDRYLTLDGRLQRVLARALLVMDFSIISGLRGPEEQDRLVVEGFSKLEWPLSKHNRIEEGEPSLAVDVAPYENGINWEDSRAFTRLAVVLFSMAAVEGVKLRWGGNWNQDWRLVKARPRQRWNDWGHFEIVEEKS